MTEQSLGHYRLLERLGEGGMGEVWRAYDPKLQRTVAIKVLTSRLPAAGSRPEAGSPEPEASSSEAEAGQRILREARAASRLSHPHICTVYDVGAADGQSFIVMEYIEGQPLSELIPADGLSSETVIRYGTQIANALAHAHEKGIIHRDLKSANVVITPEAQVKLIDFGIAVPLPEADAEAVTRTQESPVSSLPVGTLAYMAPEVLNGQAATARSDIWSLGVLLYEMVSGRLPFAGATPLDVVSAIARGAPPTLPRSVSTGLGSVIERCLQKEPALRYAAVVAVQSAMETIQSDGAWRPREPVGRIRERFWWKFGGAVIGIGVLVGAVQVMRSRLAFDPDTPSFRLTNPAQLTTASASDGGPSWSPEGQRLAFESNRAGNFDIWLTQLGGGTPVNLTNDYEGADQMASWSPDGRLIAFYSERRGGGYFVMSALDGTGVRRVMAGVEEREAVSAAVWSPDSGRLARIVPGTSPSVEVADLESGESWALPLPGNARTRLDLAWSADGRYLAYVDALSDTAQIATVWTLELESARARPVTDGKARDRSPIWAPDGRVLYFVSDRGGTPDLWQQRLAPDATPTGSPRPITTGVGMREATLAHRAGRLAYTRGRRVANVWRLPILSDRPAAWSDGEQLTFDQAFIEFLDVAPDGSRLLISSDRSGNSDLWMLDREGNELRQVTADPTPDWDPQWSPDGNQIAFYAYRGGKRDVWLMPVDGGPARRLTNFGAESRYPTWSPDGRLIAYESDESGNIDIWVQPIDGGEARRLTTDPGNDRFPSWSPDGGYIAFNSTRDDGVERLWLIPAEGGTPERLTQGRAYYPQWSPDGGTVMYFELTDREGLAGDVWAISMSDRTERRLTDLTGAEGGHGLSVWSLGTDGDSLYLAWGEDFTDIWVMDVEWEE